MIVQEKGIVLIIMPFTKTELLVFDIANIADLVFGGQTWLGKTGQSKENAEYAGIKKSEHDHIKVGPSSEILFN
jgi:hypothetical protein